MVINPIVYDEKGKGNDIFSSNLEKRIVHLVGEINEQNAASVVAQLLQLDAQGNEDISLYINSPGGEIAAGLAIYDTIQYIKSDVMTVCLGMAASMGAVIFSGGAKGKRIILPHSEIMIHQPLGGSRGQASDMLIAAEHIQKSRDVLAKILAENCGKTIDQIMGDIDRDRWLNAKEAVEYGLADSIVGQAAAA